MDAPSLYKLRAQIDMLRTDATVLLLRARHDELKAHVRTTQRDLTEALSRLQYERETKTSDLLVEVLESAIRSAARRLQMVEHALQTHGPDTHDIE